jgi:anti-sigma28 factor (negative regulator of flagellin synthesis)
VTNRFDSKFNLSSSSDSGVFMLDPADRAFLEAAAVDKVKAVDDHARFLEIARKLPKVRLDKVMKIREEIAAGTYVNEEKLQATVDRLLAALRGS